MVKNRDNFPMRAPLAGSRRAPRNMKKMYMKPQTPNIKYGLLFGKTPCVWKPFVSVHFDTMFLETKIRAIVKLCQTWSKSFCLVEACMVEGFLRRFVGCITPILNASNGLRPCRSWHIRYGALSLPRGLILQ